jgi:hypothetical protein
MHIEGTFEEPYVMKPCCRPLVWEVRCVCVTGTWLQLTDWPICLFLAFPVTL